MLDVHRDTVAACVGVPGRYGHRGQHVQIFGTTTAELLRLRECLAEHGATDVAMARYRKPIYYVLEGIQLPTGQRRAHQAQRLEHGLLRSSFVPPVPIRELRDLTRYPRG